MKLSYQNTTISSSKSESETKEVINTLTKTIKALTSEFNQYLDLDINFNNYKDIENFLTSVSATIDDCDTTENFKCNKNSDFAILVYKHQRLSLKYETWKLSSILKKTAKKQKTIEKKQKRAEKQNNNLVYNILAFIASFSIVSAAVTAFEKVSSVEDILLFMAFTAFIIITTLIALDNFYKSNNSKKIKLNDNYFLWKVLIVVIFSLLIYKSVDYFKDNQAEIFENLGKGIETVRIEYENNKN